jgi:uncharacterized protein YndB with AHSA1/START domain
MQNSSTDRIVKQVLLRVPRARAWQAIADPDQFGQWFGMRFDGPFVAGTELLARIEPTTVDADVARLQAPHAGLLFLFKVERIEPERLFAFRWHPHAVDAAKDYSAEPSTLVEFSLEDVPEGVRLTVTESGFDAIPLERRATAFEANSEGWRLQTMLIEKFLARVA